MRIWGHKFGGHKFGASSGDTIPNYELSKVSPEFVKRYLTGIVSPDYHTVPKGVFILDGQPYNEHPKDKPADGK